MQPLQSELVMRSINTLAEKYSQDRNRVELLQPYLGDTSCLSKVGDNMYCIVWQVKGPICNVWYGKVSSQCVLYCMAR